jgi:hypothetical protein
LDKGQEEGRPWGLVGSQVWGPTPGEWRRRERSGQKRDMSKVKCFVCKKFGHYAGQCLNRKKKGGTATTTEEIDFQTQFQRECAFLTCCTSVETTPRIWYIDSGASSHIIGL